MTVSKTLWLSIQVLEGGVNLIEQVEKLEREGEDMERNMMIQRRQEEELARRLRWGAARAGARATCLSL